MSLLIFRSQRRPEIWHGLLDQFSIRHSCSVIVTEMVFRHKIWCRRLITLAAYRIDDPLTRSIKLEEWLAALEEHVGMVASLSHAIGCWVGAPAVAAESKRPAVRSMRRINMQASLQAEWHVRVTVERFRFAHRTTKWILLAAALMGGSSAALFVKWSFF